MQVFRKITILKSPQGQWPLPWGVFRICSQSQIQEPTRGSFMISNSLRMAGCPSQAPLSWVCGVEMLCCVEMTDLQVIWTTRGVSILRDTAVIYSEKTSLETYIDFIYIFIIICPGYHKSFMFTVSIYYLFSCLYVYLSIYHLSIYLSICLPTYPLSI